MIDVNTYIEERMKESDSDRVRERDSETVCAYELGKEGFKK